MAKWLFWQTKTTGALVTAAKFIAEWKSFSLVAPGTMYSYQPRGTLIAKGSSDFAVLPSKILAGTVSADPDEVGDARWEPWAPFRAAVLDGSRTVSVWCREQVAQLPADPLAAAAADVEDLPPAAQVVASRP